MAMRKILLIALVLLAPMLSLDLVNDVRGCAVVATVEP
jgi:hypothetical protein